MNRGAFYCTQCRRMHVDPAIRHEPLKVPAAPSEGPFLTRTQLIRSAPVVMGQVKIWP